MKILKNIFINAGKYEWCIPIVEVLIILPIFLLFCDHQDLILHYNYIYVSALGKTLLEIAIIEQSIVAFILAFTTFAAKIVAAFFILKKSKWGYLAVIILYLSDFIVALLRLFTDETTLQEWSVNVFASPYLTLSIVPAVSCEYVYEYFNTIKHRKKTKEFKIFTVIIFSVLICSFSFAWIDGNKKIASETEVATLNRCYEYSEKYLYQKLPDDKVSLEKMQGDIEEVFSSELFFTAFNQSEYFGRLKEEQKVKGYSPIQMKSMYANELMYLKSKILLELDKNEEYIDYYIETRQYFSTAEVEFFYKYLEKDIKNYSEDDCGTVKKASEEFMRADVNRIEKLWAAIDYSKVVGKDLQEEERNEIAKQIRNEFLPDYSTEQMKEDLINAEEYEVMKRSLYMLKETDL